MSLEIVLVGAHMAGLPLNADILALEGRFLRAAETEPCYRLFALPGGPPARPGLLRVEAGTGAAIAVEVWAIPSARIGALLASIPAPLGLGTLRLADGTLPKGFLVEAEGTRGAIDISHFGGWRAFLAQPRLILPETTDGPWNFPDRFRRSVDGADAGVEHRRSTISEPGRDAAAGAGIWS